MINMKRMPWVYIALMIFSATTAFGNGYRIEGKVISDKGKALSGANIRINGIEKGAVAGSGGRFVLSGLQAGEYELIVSMVGYSTEKADITIPAGKPLTIEMAEQPMQTSEVVVSANKRIQAVQEVPVSVAVVDLESMISRGISEMDEALAYIPGVEMLGEDVSIRGSAGFAFGLGSRVALLIDGFPMLSADNGDVKFDALPVFDIKRIEVVKGAGSALYGTSALGGVINVITEDAQQEYIKLRAFSGIYTDPEYEQWQYTGKARLSSGIEAGAATEILGVESVFSGGVYSDDGYTRYNDTRRWNLFAKFRKDLSQRTILRLQSTFARSNSADWVYWNSLDSATIPPTGTDESIRIESDKLSLFSEVKHFFSGNDFMIFRAGLFKTGFENSHPDDHPEKRASDAYAYNSQMQFNLSFTENLMLTSGADLKYNSVDAKTYGGESNQTIAAVYAQGEAELFDALNLTLGSRVDYERTGGYTGEEEVPDHLEISPKLGANYSLPFGGQLRMSVGKGFRAATIAEKFAAVEFQGFEVVANPGLEPERSWSYEIGAMYEFEEIGFPLEVDVSVFRNELFNLIEPSIFEEQEGSIKFRNVTRARISGAELVVKSFLFNTLGIESGLTLMHPRDLTNDETLKYRSEMLWYSRVILPLGLVELQADYRYKSEYENIDEELKFQVSDYDAKVPVHVLDARASLDLGEMTEYPITVSLNAKNLLDYYYVEMVGNLAPTRYISLQLTLER
jgi:iron complex outermembrane receptor protein